jgi:hypothetical protein
VSDPIDRQRRAILSGALAAGTAMTGTLEAALAKPATAMVIDVKWMASLPWDFASDAIAELRRAKDAGAVGICMLTNIVGTPLTDHVTDRDALRSGNAIKLFGLAES